MKPLYPHQERAVGEAVALSRRGIKRILIVAPTGAGKTRVACELSLRANRARILWLTHRTELIDQAVESLQGECTTDIGVVQADDPRANPGARVQVASVQTLTARGDRPTADVVIVDECHHVKAATWNAVLRSYDGKTIIGLTATPERGDGKALGDVFDALVTAAQYSELIAAGKLVDADVCAPTRRLTGSMASTAAAAYLARGQGRPTIAFLPTVEMTYETVAALQGAGVRCGAVTGDTPASARAIIVEHFRTGDLDVIANCLVLTEGFDAPRASCAIIGRACTHAGTYLQICGRVLRTYPGKTRALILDLTGAVLDHGWPTADRAYALAGTAIRQSAPAPASIWQCLSCGWCSQSRPTACPRCGAVPPPPKPIRIVEDPLVRYERFETDPLPVKREYLQRMLLEASSRGYKRGWAMFKYKSKYGVWPSNNLM